MPTPSDDLTLLDALPADGSALGNQALRTTLGWEEERYAAARDALVSQGKALKGPGRGGSLRRAVAAPATATPSEPKPMSAPTPPLAPPPLLHRARRP